MATSSVGKRTLERVRREAARGGHERQKMVGSLALATNPGRGKKVNPRDPVMVGEVLASFNANNQVAKKLLLPQIAEIWEQTVGTLVAQHSTPKYLADDVLHVAADSSVWAAQLSVLNQMLVTKINASITSGTISRIQVSGPKANTPNYGPRTVKGRIGYRDTFG
jgi:predicted nucleic acid-binding Zn ribbon protein